MNVKFRNLKKTHKQVSLLCYETKGLIYKFMQFIGTEKNITLINVKALTDMNLFYSLIYLKQIYFAFK